MMTNDLNENANDSMRESLEYYKESNQSVHLSMKNLRFYNGSIIEVKEAIIILEEKKLGRIPVPISEIFLVEKFIEPQ